MFKKLLVSLLMGIIATFGAIAVASPAQASSVYGCNDDLLCIYRWTQFNTGGGIWTTSMGHLDNQVNNCIDFGTIPWPNDTSMADNSGSIILNGSFPTHPNAYVDLYDWPNCNGNGEFIRIAINQLSMIQHLSSVPGAYQVTGPWDAYHQIHSVRLFGY